MSFLFPSVLWGLFAVSLPLVIHFISHRNTNIVDFSSIRHIQELEHETIRKLIIRQWLLIVLRMCIIAALVIMVSGPVQINDSAWIPSEKESTVVIIIDNSASMAVTKDRTSFLDQVKLELPKVKCPALQIHSTIDMLSIPENISLVYDNISSEVKEKLLVHKANHNLFMPGPDQEEIYSKIVSFFNQFKKTDGE